MDRRAELREFIIEKLIAYGRVTQENLHIFTDRINLFMNATCDSSIVRSQLANYEMLEFIGDGMANGIMSTLQTEIFDLSELNGIVGDDLVHWMTVVRNSLRSNFLFGAFAIKLGFYRFVRATIGRYIKIIFGIETSRIYPSIGRPVIDKLMKQYPSIKRCLTGDEQYASLLNRGDLDTLLAMEAPPCFLDALETLIGKFKGPLDLFKNPVLEKFLGDNFEAFIGAIAKATTDNVRIHGPAYGLCYQIINSFIVDYILEANGKYIPWIVFALMVNLNGKKHLEKVLFLPSVVDGPSKALSDNLALRKAEQIPGSKPEMYIAKRETTRDKFITNTGNPSEVIKIQPVKLGDKQRASVIASYLFYTKLVNKSLINETLITSVRSYTTRSMERFLKLSLKEYARRMSS